MKFGRLEPIGFVGWREFPSGNRQRLWKFKCDCGKEHVALLHNVKRGHTTSCGCYLNQRRIEAHTTHGDNRKGKRTKLYTVWATMKQRCEDVNYRHYPRWGGRGIKILWASYEEFKRDMGPSFQPGLQIERVNNDGHYCKENCKWATAKEQARNRSSNVLMMFNGQTKTMIDWAEACGLRYSTLHRRISLGWSVECALTTPVYSRTAIPL